MPHHNRHYGGDPFSNTGVWGPPTSAANFCEEDYVITRYLAEFVNSLTNLIYVYLALRYAWTPRVPQNPRQAPAGPGTGTRAASAPAKVAPGFDAMAVSLVVLGITSFAFHASLLQPAQFADDMSMLITAGALLQGVYCAAGGGVQRPPRQRAAISAAVYAVVAAMAAAYVQSGKIIVHLAMFTAMVHAVWPRTVYLIFRRADGSAAERNRLFRNFGVAIAWLLVGFVLWNVDLELCHGLRGWRAVVGLPWAWLLELHGWWHIMTGIGAAMYMDLIRELE